MVLQVQAVGPAAEGPSALLGSADAFVGSFDHLLPRFPRWSREIGQRELMAPFPRRTPAPLSSARRDREAAETLTEPVDPDGRCPSQPDVASFHPG